MGNDILILLGAGRKQRMLGEARKLKVKLGRKCVSVV